MERVRRVVKREREEERGLCIVRANCNEDWVDISPRWAQAEP